MQKEKLRRPHNAIGRRRIKRYESVKKMNKERVPMKIRMEYGWNET